MVANKNYVRANKRAAMQRAQDALLIGTKIEQEVALVEEQLTEAVTSEHMRAIDQKRDLNFYALHIALEIGAATRMEEVAFDKRLLAASYVYQAFLLCKQEKQPWQKWHEQHLPQWKDTSVAMLLKVGQKATHDEQVEVLQAQRDRNAAANRRLRSKQKLELAADREGGNVRLLLGSKSEMSMKDKALLSLQALPSGQGLEVMETYGSQIKATVKQGRRTYYTWETLLLDFRQLSRESQAEFLAQATAVYNDGEADLPTIEGEATHAA